MATVLGAVEVELRRWEELGEKEPSHTKKHPGTAEKTFGSTLARAQQFRAVLASVPGRQSTHLQARILAHVTAFTAGTESLDSLWKELERLVLTLSDGEQPTLATMDAAATRREVATLECLSRVACALCVLSLAWQSLCSCYISQHCPAVYRGLAKLSSFLRLCRSHLLQVDHHHSPGPRIWSTSLSFIAGALCLQRGDLPQAAVHFDKAKAAPHTWAAASRLLLATSLQRQQWAAYEQQLVPERSSKDNSQGSDRDKSCGSSRDGDNDVLLQLQRVHLYMDAHRFDRAQRQLHSIIGRNKHNVFRLVAARLTASAFARQGAWAKVHKSLKIARDNAAKLDATLTSSGDTWQHPVAPTHGQGLWSHTADVQRQRTLTRSHAFRVPVPNAKWRLAAEDSTPRSSVIVTATTPAAPPTCMGEEADTATCAVKGTQEAGAAVVATPADSVFTGIHLLQHAKAAVRRVHFELCVTAARAHARTGNVSDAAAAYRMALAWFMRSRHVRSSSTAGKHGGVWERSEDKTAQSCTAAEMDDDIGGGGADDDDHDTSASAGGALPSCACHVFADKPAVREVQALARLPLHTLLRDRQLHLPAGKTHNVNDCDVLATLAASALVTARTKHALLSATRRLTNNRRAREKEEGVISEGLSEAGDRGQAASASDVRSAHDTDSTATAPAITPHHTVLETVCLLITERHPAGDGDDNGGPNSEVTQFQQQTSRVVQSLITDALPSNVAAQLPVASSSNRPDAIMCAALYTDPALLDAFSISLCICLAHTCGEGSETEESGEGKSASTSSSTAVGSPQMRVECWRVVYTALVHRAALLQAHSGGPGAGGGGAGDERGGAQQTARSTADSVDVVGVDNQERGCRAEEEGRWPAAKRAKRQQPLPQCDRRSADDAVHWPRDAVLKLLEHVAIMWALDLVGEQQGAKRAVFVLQRTALHLGGGEGFPPLFSAALGICQLSAGYSDMGKRSLMTATAAAASSRAASGVPHRVVAACNRLIEQL